MKTNIIKRGILFFLLSIIATGCIEYDGTQLLIDDIDSGNGSGSVDDVSATELLGTWEAVSVDYSGTSITESGGISITADFVAEGYNIDFTFTINENPDIVTSEGFYDVKLTTTIMGVSSVTLQEGMPFATEGPWELNGDELTFNAGEIDESKATIVEITETSLKLYIETTQTSSENGYNLTFTAYYNVAFTK